jgi:hypothetical protein
VLSKDEVRPWLNRTALRRLAMRRLLQGEQRNSGIGRVSTHNQVPVIEIEAQSVIQ